MPAGPGQPLPAAPTPEGLKKKKCVPPLQQVSSAPAGARFPGNCPAPPEHHPTAAHPRPAPTQGLWRASPVRSKQPSSAHSRTAVCQQLTMVSATRPAGPVPALYEADSAAARAGPLALLTGAARALLRACSRSPPLRRPASASRCARAPEPALSRCRHYHRGLSATALGASCGPR